MATIIRSENVDEGVQRAVFGGTQPEPSEGQPMVAPRVDRQGIPLPSPDRPASLPAPEPAARAQSKADAKADHAAPEAEAAPAPPPPPPPPPVFEVPGEILQGVYDQAVAQGLEDGKNQVFAELTILQERYAAALDGLVGVSRELQAHNRVQLIGMACAIAEKLVRGHLKAHPGELLTLIGEVLQQVEGSDEVVVSCGPDDHAYLVERQEALADGAGGSFKVRVVADPALEYGDFKVETRHGATDGRVSTRLGAVERDLRAGDDDA